MRLSMLRRTPPALFLLAVSVGLAACGGSSSTASKTLVIGQVANPDTLDGPNSQSIEAGQILAQITDTLYEPAPPAGTKLVPALATGYTLSKDKRTWTFHLRPGVRFSNGAPLTPADVRFSILNAQKGQAQGQIDRAITSVKVAGPHDVAITTAAPDSALLADIAYYANGIVPANFAGQPAKQFWRHPVGTGPFRVARWNYGTALVLKRNPHYWRRGLPKLDSVVFKPVPDDASRVAQLQAGTLTAIEAPPIQRMAALAKDSRVSLHRVPGAQIDALYLNAESGPLANATVRRALSLAIDRNSIVRSLLPGQGLPATSLEPLTMPLFGPRPAPLPYDAQQAKQVLAKTKYARGFKLGLIVAAGNSFAPAVAQVLQSEFAPLGVKVEISVQDQSTAIANLVSGKYDMMFVPSTVGMTDPDPEAQTEPAVMPKQIRATLNFPEMGRLAVAAQRTFDPARRQSIYERWLRLYGAPDDPIPVDFQPIAYATTSAVKGFYLENSGGIDLTTTTIGS